MTEDQRGFRIPEAVAYTGLPRTRLYDAIKDGSLRSMKVGKARIIFREDLDAWMDQLIVTHHTKDSA